MIHAGRFSPRQKNRIRRKGIQRRTNELHRGKSRRKSGAYTLLFRIEGKTLQRSPLSSLFGPEKTLAPARKSPRLNGTSRFRRSSTSRLLHDQDTSAVYDEEGHRIFHWEIAEGQKFLRAFAVKFIEPRMNMLKKIIEQGVENGEFSVASPFLTVSTLFLLIMGLKKARRFLKEQRWERRSALPTTTVFSSTM